MEHNARHQAVSAHLFSRSSLLIYTTLPDLSILKWSMGAMRIRHSIREIANQPVILWILLGGTTKWLPLNFGFNDVMRTAPITIIIANGNLRSLRWLIIWREVDDQCASPQFELSWLAVEKNVCVSVCCVGIWRRERADHSSGADIFVDVLIGQGNLRATQTHKKSKGNKMLPLVEEHRNKVAEDSCWNFD